MDGQRGKHGKGSGPAERRPPVPLPHLHRTEQTHFEHRSPIAASSVPRMQDNDIGERRQDMPNSGPPCPVLDGPAHRADPCSKPGVRDMFRSRPHSFSGVTWLISATRAAPLMGKTTGASPFV
ncbi:hypothetical protein SAV14893_009440 [Streptomyces avermitilis]|uniref:Uncharacterized protein n=1 Tax=Streptomyces avermitilis TaxID=33903 RepID=A0A4D4LIX1_STRAX|nr:hypothetical protein SAVMC3_21550 [Streptomyces avermitilis]GDY61551.1 hypothetical protein SAV14893_009440 [Streptomyces avermitilis]GDY78347.1 hypothetical protein SAV31267_078320 [Streptomyces avermitilis]GDY87200.1 hypothetical protein SAVCW2_63990 [Streptomyces avermitilis]